MQAGQRFFKKLIVSCQAKEGECFRDPVSMARFATAAVEGGAAAVRAQGPEDVREIRKSVDVPILGVRKIRQDDGQILITPTFESAEELIAAGADMIALDATRRGCKYGALGRIRAIREKLGVPVLADIATIYEALVAAEAGADFVLTTMRGYTEETAAIQGFDLEFVRELVARSPVPVIAEGKIETPEQAEAALIAGCYAVVVGSAITRPNTIARRFADAIESGGTGAGA
jgi:putative N-acetylmannosamine-6-phosphate epimerase